MAILESSISHRVQTGGVCPTSQEGLVKEKPSANQREVGYFSKSRTFSLEARSSRNKNRPPATFQRKHKHHSSLSSFYPTSGGGYQIAFRQTSTI